MKPLYTQEEFERAKGKDKLALECYQCGETFYNTKHHIKLFLIGKRGTGEYCSVKCSAQSNVSKINVTCKNCGCEFQKLKNQCEKHPNHFCSRSCSAIFNNKKRTHSIKSNKKTSETIIAKHNKHDDVLVTCKNCSESFSVEYHRRFAEFCSRKCAISSVITREKIAISTINNIKNGITYLQSIKMIFTFNGKKINCDSKIEYAGLDWFIKNYNVINIERCEFDIKYIDHNNKPRRYLPDFKIKTDIGIFIMECKGKLHKSLSDRWGSYNENAAVKKVVLQNYCSDNNLLFMWFMPDMHLKFYNSLSKRKDYVVPTELESATSSVSETPSTN